MPVILDALHSALLAVHVVAGAAGLLLALPTLWVAKRRGAHTALGRAYAAAAFALTLGAVGLVAYAPTELWGFGVLSLVTGLCVGGGVWLARRRPRVPGGGWYAWHIALMGSSVISFVTGFAVQMADRHLLAWVLPTAIGSPLIARRTAIARGARSHRRRRRPEASMATMPPGRVPDHDAFTNDPTGRRFRRRSASRGRRQPQGRAYVSRVAPPGCRPSHRLPDRGLGRGQPAADAD